MNKRDISLLKNDPFRELKRLQRSFFNDPFFNFGLIPQTSLLLDRDYLSASSEYEEDKDNYYVSVELPGIPKDKINIDADKNHLVISGEREEEKLEEGKQKHYSEFYYGKIRREYHFPELINQENITASYKNGILKVKVPKSTQTKSVKIEIGEGEDSENKN